MDWEAIIQATLIASGGAILLKAFQYIGDSIKGNLAKRRSEVDRITLKLISAVKERDEALTRVDEVEAERDREANMKRQFILSAHAHRVMMIKSGHFTEADLPVLPREE